MQTFSALDFRPRTKWLLVRPRCEYLRRIMFDEEESEGYLKSLQILITGNHSSS